MTPARYRLMEPIDCEARRGFPLPHTGRAMPCTSRIYDFRPFGLQDVRCSSITAPLASHMVSSVSGLHQHRIAFAKLRRHAISKAAEGHARNLDGDSRRDALLMAMHYADGADRARLFAEAAAIQGRACCDIA